MKSGTSTLVDKTKRVLDGIAFVTGTRVMVGIPSDRAGSREGDINNAALLYIHDNGAPEVGIPPRPVVDPGIRDAQKDVENYLAVAGGRAMDGNKDAAERALHAAGMKASMAVRSRINSNTPPPLADSTLAKRKARGITRTNTLVDTGQMRNAVTYVLRKA